MALLTQDEQHDGRNAVQCLEGFMRRLKKENRINDQEQILCFVWLKKIDRIFNLCPDSEKQA